jgi:hypothetical protein
LILDGFLVRLREQPGGVDTLGSQNLAKRLSSAPCVEYLLAGIDDVGAILRGTLIRSPLAISHHCDDFSDLNWTWVFGVLDVLYLLVTVRRYFDQFVSKARNAIVRCPVRRPCDSIAIGYLASLTGTLAKRALNVLRRCSLLLEEGSRQSTL